MLWNDYIICGIGMPLNLIRIDQYKGKKVEL